TSESVNCKVIRVVTRSRFFENSLRITMSEADDDCDFDENADPNTSHVSQRRQSNTR
ncbi:Uncharacterized protein APZ42_004658, partial [Daphnia magna]